MFGIETNKEATEVVSSRWTPRAMAGCRKHAGELLNIILLCTKTQPSHTGLRMASAA
jgi:hypothetical protein